MSVFSNGLRIAALLIALAASAALADGIVNIGSTVPGSVTTGDLVVGLAPNQVQDASAFAGPAIVPLGLQFTNNIVYSGAYTINQQWMSLQSNTLTGTAGAPIGDGVIAPFNLSIGQDVVDTTTNGNGNLVLFNVNHATSGGTGGRIVIQATENIVGTPTLQTGAGYTAISGITRVSANMGGATGAFGNYKGSPFGGNFNIFTTSAATFLSIVQAQQNDVEVAAGSSTAEKHALSLVQGSNDAVSGVYDNAALQFAAGDGASTTWSFLIDLAGGYSHQTSAGAATTLIGGLARVLGPSSPRIALNGVDLSVFTFQTGGCAFKSTGFCIDPAGKHTGTNVALTAAAPTVTASQIGYGSTVAANTNCGTLASSAGCVVINVAGTTRYMPYYHHPEAMNDNEDEVWYKRAVGF